MNPLQQELPLALVNGEPVREVPEDLYIPPDALSVILDAFEGPLDLLLYLIRRQNMDILNIDVSKITHQYMHYIDMLREMRFELAAEYLLMAAMLAEIKSRVLLPVHKEDEEDVDDPRAELIRRLQEYERFKKAALEIDELPRKDREFFPATVSYQHLIEQASQPAVSMQDLMAALSDVMARSDRFQSHEIARERLSTRERMTIILERVRHDRFVSFYNLFSIEEGRAGVVVTFLAMMELLKEGLVSLVQTEHFAPIHITAHEGETDDR